MIVATGGGRGIGSAACGRLAEEGARVAAEISAYAAGRVAAEIAAAGCRSAASGGTIDVASVVGGGERGRPGDAAAKAAVASLIRTLAAEFVPAVAGSAAAPGLTRTPGAAEMPERQAAWLLALAFDRRMAEPEGIADAVAFFATGSARFVTGEIVAVAGELRPHL